METITAKEVCHRLGIKEGSDLGKHIYYACGGNAEIPQRFWRHTAWTQKEYDNMKDKSGFKLIKG